MIGNIFEYLSYNFGKLFQHNFWESKYRSNISHENLASVLRCVLHYTSLGKNIQYISIVQTII